MIVKMKFLNITGPKSDIDRVMNVYLSKYEIQLENALSELKTVKDLRPYIEANPYKEDFETAKAEALETLWGYGGEEARGWWQARHDSLTELFCSD